MLLSVLLSAILANLVTSASQSDMNTMLSLLNQQRAMNNIGPLCLNDALSAVSAAYAQVLGNGPLDHNKGQSFQQRMNNAGYGTAGENLATGNMSPQDAVTAWMNSEGHKENILNGAYNIIGIAGGGDQAWVNDFAAVPGAPCSGGGPAPTPNSPAPTPQPAPQPAPMPAPQPASPMPASAPQPTPTPAPAPQPAPMPAAMPTAAPGVGAVPGSEQFTRSPEITLLTDNSATVSTSAGGQGNFEVSLTESAINSNGPLNIRISRDMINNNNIEMVILRLSPPSDSGAGGMVDVQLCKEMQDGSTKCMQRSVPTPENFF